MNAELKTKWTKALRSGKYKQGYGNLRDEDGNFCVIGVLCDVADPTLWKYDPDRKFYMYGGSYCYYSTTNPDATLYGGLQAHISRQNDNVKKSFFELADEIDAWSWT